VARRAAGASSDRDLLGVLVRRGEQVSFRAFGPPRLSLRIGTAHVAGARHHDVVRVAALRGRPTAGRVVEVLGPLDGPGVDVRVAIRLHGLAESFPGPVLAEAAALPAAPDGREIRRRERFDDPEPVTIDGETARDFDDAVAVARLPGGGFRLFVHVADVSYFVRPGSALDREARARGTSVYFPDRVLPMLPERLSNDLCSLAPGQERLVRSVVLDLDSRGATTGVRLAAGVIRSAARLTYRQVAAALAGQGGHRVPAPIARMLECADELCRRLARRRQARGSLDFDLPEPELLLDVDGVVTGIRVEPRSPAHRMIEEFMLAANEAVAGEFAGRGLPCLWRVHEPPDGARLDELEAWTGRPAGSRTDWTDARAVRALLDRFEGRPEARVVGPLVLRALKAACYSVRPAGHFGLAVARYCQFTSPIRRYPDLLIHRLLCSSRGRGRAAVDDVRALARLAESCSRLEREAEAAEREVLAAKKAAFMAGHVGTTHDARVTGVAAFGVFAAIDDPPVEGLIPLARLGAERFELGRLGTELVGVRTGVRFGLGDRLRVRVERVDRIERRVCFALEAPAEPPGDRVVDRRGRRSGRRRVIS